MYDFIKDVINKFGKWVYLIILALFLLGWAIAHNLTEPGDKVNIFGVFEYKKKAEDPTPAPELFAQLESLITSTKKSHISLFQNSFREKRNIIDQFINEQWMLEFTKKFFQSDSIKNLWKNVGDNPEEMQKAFQKIGSLLQERINEKRAELISPIDEIENKIENDLNEHYERLYAILNSLVYYHLSAKQSIEYRSYKLKYLVTQGIDFESVLKETNNKFDGITEIFSITDELGKKIDNKDIDETNLHNKLLELKETIIGPKPHNKQMNTDK